MQKVVRTTFTAPEDFLMMAKYYALSKKKSLSELIRESLIESMKIVYPQAKKKQVSMLDLAGMYSLGGKKPPSRNELYEENLKKKISL